ncbi:MAG: class I SAM-dependent methyltransferase [Patescibacteria group bacterium]
MNTPYDSIYYKTRYVDPFHVRLRVANVYYLWLAFFCIIIPGKLKKGSKVLDVGCGVGNLVWALRFFGIDAYGIDPSTSAKRYCRIPQYCQYKNVEKLPYEDFSFDLIYTNEVLEHIEEENLNRIIIDMSRLSKKMIHMIGVKERGEMIINDPTHLTIKKENWWGKKFKRLGFDVKMGNLFYFFPHKAPISGFKRGYFYISNNK